MIRIERGFTGAANAGAFLLLAAIIYAQNAFSSEAPAAATNVERSASDDKAIRPFRVNVPEKELADAWKQIESVRTLLNSNFKPQQDLGNALFKDNHLQVLSVLDHICTGKSVPDERSRCPATLPESSRKMKSASPSGHCCAI